MRSGAMRIPSPQASVKFTADTSPDWSAGSVSSTDAITQQRGVPGHPLRS
jgi:hypothetical protein